MDGDNPENGAEVKKLLSILLRSTWKLASSAEIQI